ncbi:MAG: hypothetical protein NT086_12045 [Proteobacteria bacterium]|nr:hypothetical protein [Pseudomonadota bacterium]
MKTIAFILPDALFTSGVTGMLDLFHFANRIAERDSGPVLHWILLSENGQAVRSASGILLAADGSWQLAAGSSHLAPMPSSCLA